MTETRDDDDDDDDGVRAMTMMWRAMMTLSCFYCWDDADAK